MNLLQKAEPGRGWQTAIHSHRLHWLLWISCPGHGVVRGNERADRLASTADITSGLQLSKAEVPKGLRNFLNMDRPEHHRINYLKERGMEKGGGRYFTFRGRERSVINLTLALCWGQPRGDCRETGRRAYGSFLALQCYLEQKLKLKLK